MSHDTLVETPTDDAVLLRTIRQAMAAAHHSADPTRRSQHPKTHGVVQAIFQVDELPPAYRVGVFATPRPIAAWIRFSNGREFDDRKRDVRGMAIKLFSAAAPDAASEVSQDFVLADHPVFFARDAADFLQFLQMKGKHGAARKHAADTGAAEGEQAALMKQQQMELVTAFPVVRDFFKSVSSPLTLEYFSQTPYRFGDRQVKYFVRPEPPAPSDSASASPRAGEPGRPGDRGNPGSPAGPGDPGEKDALRDSMVRILTTERRAVRFQFGIQLYSTAALTPIEDATKEWTAAEEVVLATITIPPQEFLGDDRRELAEALSFSPWHTLPEHEPVGSLNLARRDAYVDSSVTRHDAAHTRREPPTESDFNALTLARFFESFRTGDIAGMQRCLHPDVEFRDIGFDLRGRQVAAMWHLVVANGIKVSYRDLHVDGQTGTAHWDGDYQFRKDAGSAPRPVHNAIDSRFVFAGGLIRVHEDRCDFWKWFEQAIGPVAKAAHAVTVLEGALEHILNRDVPVNVEVKAREKVRATAHDKIETFIGAHPEYAA